MGLGGAMLSEVMGQIAVDGVHLSMRPNKVKALCLSGITLTNQMVLGVGVDRVTIA
jgi:hypothetical protein